MKKEMSEKEVERKKVLVIDPKGLKEGTCTFQKSETGEKWAICKENGKIKLFPVVEKGEKKGEKEK